MQWQAARVMVLPRPNVQADAILQHIGFFSINTLHVIFHLKIPNPYCIRILLRRVTEYIRTLPIVLGNTFEGLCMTSAQRAILSDTVLRDGIYRHTPQYWSILP